MSPTFEKQIEKSSHLFRALGDKNRLQVFTILTYGDYTVSDIYKCLQLPQNLISHHLKVLKLEGLAKSKRLGRKIYYSLNQETLKELDLVLEKIFTPARLNVKLN